MFCLLLPGVLARAGAEEDGSVPNRNPWEKIMEETDPATGYVVFERDVPGSKSIELKITGRIDASPEVCFAIATDYAKVDEYAPYTEETRIVGQEGEDVHYVYYRITAPLVSDRDYTLRQVMHADPEAGVFTITWRSANAKGPPPRAGVVRVPSASGRWTFRRTGDGKTLATYYLFTDAGGSVPSWASNWARRRTICDILKHQRKRTADPTWKRP